jgi:hypothetical protein
MLNGSIFPIAKRSTFNRENTMQDTIIIIYCSCDDLLKVMKYRDDPQTKLSSAEVMTVPLVAACYFDGRIEWARRFLIEHGHFTVPLSQSRLNHRLHSLPVELWQTLFSLLGEVFKLHNLSGEYAIRPLA